MYYLSSQNMPLANQTCYSLCKSSNSDCRPTPLQSTQGHNRCICFKHISLMDSFNFVTRRGFSPTFCHYPSHHPYILKQSFLSHQPRLKEGTTKSHSNTLVLGVVGKGSLTKFATNTGLLEAAEWPVCSASACTIANHFSDPGGGLTVDVRACCSLWQRGRVSFQVVFQVLELY